MASLSDTRKADIGRTHPPPIIGDQVMSRPEAKDLYKSPLVPKQATRSCEIRRNAPFLCAVWTRSVQ
jgi:hypothetical protein